MGTSLRGQRRQDSPVPRPPYPTPTRQALGAAALEAAQGAPRDPRRDSRGDRSPWLPLETQGNRLSCRDQEGSLSSPYLLFLKPPEVPSPLEEKEKQ